uniref:Ovule protein n=1 Tax=Heterorhabditis bacteriophora TaxID=37862 RepID=A0A1I7WEN1_HETBA
MTVHLSFPVSKYYPFLLSLSTTLETSSIAFQLKMDALVVNSSFLFCSNCLNRNLELLSSWAFLSNGQYYFVRPCSSPRRKILVSSKLSPPFPYM